MATFSTSGVDHDMGLTHKSLHSEKGRVVIWGVGAVQRPAETVPPLWFAKVDGGPDVLQRGDSLGVVYD